MSNISPEMMEKIRAARVAMAEASSQTSAEPQQALGPVMQGPGTVTSRAIYIPSSKNERGGLAISIVVSMALMFVVWILNGLTNVVGAALPLYYIVQLINNGMALIYRFTGGTWVPIRLALWVVLIVGVITHIGMSTIEQHMWRARQPGFMVWIVMVGSLDVMLAAIAVQFVFGWYETLSANFVATLLGGLVALAPEPVFFRLYRILKAYMSVRGRQ